MSNWVTPQDIIDRWVGNDVPTNMDLMQALVEDAEAVILAEYPAIQGRIDEEKLALSVVKMVVVRMVTRVLRNPESVSYWQQTTGPFGQARNFGDNVDIWMTTEEKNLLAPKNRGKAFELNLAPKAGVTEVYWMTGNGYEAID